MTLTIELPEELEQQLRAAAAAEGKDPADFARAALEEKLAAVRDPYAGLPRRSWAELEALARAQGAPLAARFEDLLGDFWPEDETADEFIATLREWRREEPRALP